jgi:hypothetical protein
VQDCVVGLVGVPPSSNIKGLPAQTQLNKIATPLSHDLRASAAFDIADGAAASRNRSDARDRAPRASRDPYRPLK